jgi:glycerophosphoryl diester phosphodiesterase
VTPRIVGHRGASATHPENTLAAITAAKDAGADGIELDVRRTEDDVLVVHHDAHLADGRLISQTQADDLPESVPTLADAMMVGDDMWINIEMKNSPDDPDYDASHGISIAVAGLILAFDAEDRVLVSSFDVGGILRIRETAPSIRIGWVCYGRASPAGLIGRASGHKMAAIHPHDPLVDQSFVTNAHAQGLEVNVWTVDDPDRLRELASFGVDALITNDPRAARAALTG